MANADIIAYKDALVIEMRRFGACATEIRMITEDMVRDYMARNMQPRDVAWAIVE